MFELSLCHSESIITLRTENCRHRLDTRCDRAFDWALKALGTSNAKYTGPLAASQDAAKLRRLTRDLVRGKDVQLVR